MSVRQQRRRDPKTGKETKFWIVDLTVQIPGGSIARFREVPKIQTRRGAEQYERQRLAELLAGRQQPKEVPAPVEKREVVPTIAAFTKQFIDNYAVANNKPSEVASKQSALRFHILPVLGHLSLDKVGPAQIEAFKAMKLKEGLSPKTVNNHLIVLRRMLSVAEEWELIKHVPKFKWLKVPEVEFDFLTFEEAAKFLATGEGEWRTMIAVAMKAGLRQGEILGLRWKDVDLVTGKIIVRQSSVRGIVGTPKGWRSREIELCSDLWDILKAHRHLRGELVFCDLDGQMLTKNQCRRPLYDVCKRASLRQIGWHVLRHTFASHLVMRGVPIRVVQELLGHRDIKTTMRYAHLSPQSRRDAVALLDANASHEATVRQQKPEIVVNS